MSSPSRDRVRFVLETHSIDVATSKAFVAAFDMTVPRRTGEALTIICRPSEFARFLIYRNDNGGKNSFKELSPTLFSPQRDRNEFDVSENPAT
jgi:hypothetical protein